MQTVHLDHKPRAVPTQWHELSPRQLLRLAARSLRAEPPHTLALRTAIDLLGLSIAPPASRRPQTPTTPLWIRKPNRTYRAVDPLTARDMIALCAWIFKDQDVQQGIIQPQITAYPLPAPPHLAPWEPNLGNVRLDEFLLLIDTLTLIAQQPSTHGHLDTPPWERLLFILFRPKDPRQPDGRQPLEAYTPRAARRAARPFPPPRRLIALWAAQGLLQALAHRYPHVLGKAHAHPKKARPDQPDDQPDDQPPASHLVYTLAQGQLHRIPAIRSAYAIDALQLLQRHANRTNP